MLEAVKSGAASDVVAALVRMREDEARRQAEQALNAAMVRFQAECPVVAKTQRVKFGQTDYSFAPLDEVVNTITPIANRCGLTWSWTATFEQGSQLVCCTVHHIGGASRTAEFRCPVEGTKAMSGPQQNASALSYAKRQTLQCVLGITTGEPDDDGRDGKPRDANPVTAEEMSRLRLRLRKHIPNDSERLEQVHKFGVTGNPAELASWSRESFAAACQWCDQMEGVNPLDGKVGE